MNTRGWPPFPDTAATLGRHNRPEPPHCKYQRAASAAAGLDRMSCDIERALAAKHIGIARSEIQFLMTWAETIAAKDLAADPVAARHESLLRLRVIPVLRHLDATSKTLAKRINEGKPNRKAALRFADAVAAWEALLPEFRRAYAVFCLAASDAVGSA